MAHGARVLSQVSGEWKCSKEHLVPLRDRYAHRTVARAYTHNPSVGNAVGFDCSSLEEKTVACFSLADMPWHTAAPLL
jgi:hypothetical protein